MTIEKELPVSRRGRFSGKTAVVTGAAQGIGKAVSLRLGREGAALALFDISEKVKETANALSADGIRALPFCLDVGDGDAVRRGVAETAKRYAGIDILVNNAGLVRPKALEEVIDDDWDTVVRVNLKGTFHCTRFIVPHMKKQRSGKIVNISSRASLGKLDRTVYSATKAGLIGMARTWALELAPYGITVNNVAPGPIATELFTRANPPGAPKTEAILRSVPLGRMGTPEDVANAVAFFASEEAGFITGQTLFVCGGITVGSSYF